MRIGCSSRPQSSRSGSRQVEELRLDRADRAGRRSSTLSVVIAARSISAGVAARLGDARRCMIPGSGRSTRITVRKEIHDGNDDRQQRRQRRGAARCARSAEGAPEAAQVHLAGVLQVAERHAQQDDGPGLPRPRRGAEAQDRVHVRGRSSGDLRVRGSRHHAGRVRARRPRELPDGRRRGRRAESRHPAAFGRGEARRLDGHPGHPRHRQRRAQRLRRHQGHVQHRRRRVARRRSRRSSRSRRSARPSTTSSPTRRT